MWLSLFKRKTQSYGMGKRCRRCGANFFVTSIELAFLRQHVLAEPVCCRACLRTITTNEFSAETHPHVTGPDVLRPRNSSSCAVR
ncbi:MAG TPA: hypothetical protein PLP17_16010 [Oligoflexia bacterium]|nr:hypothetical protein [Oligoflexia bacterium]